MDVQQDINSTFRADEERTESQISRKIPDCIAWLPSENPSRQPLTFDELRQARRELLNTAFAKFKRETKNKVDPSVPQQSYGLISFIPSQNAIPDRDGCYGVIKLRGNFATEDSAEKHSEELLRVHDSLSEIHITHVGRDFPLMRDTKKYCEKTREIDIRKKIDDTVLSHQKQKRNEELKEREEIMRRQEKLLDTNNSAEKFDAVDDLDYYVQLRVKKANAQYTIDDNHRKIDDARKVVESTEKDILDLETKFPEYRKQYAEKYERALTEVGNNPKENPLIKYMKLDDQAAEAVTVADIETVADLNINHADDIKNSL
jgi:hypothetical protein